MVYRATPLYPLGVLLLTAIDNDVVIFVMVNVAKIIVTRAGVALSCPLFTGFRARRKFAVKRSYMLTRIARIRCLNIMDTSCAFCYL